MCQPRAHNSIKEGGEICRLHQLAVAMRVFFYTLREGYIQFLMPIRLTEQIFLDTRLLDMWMAIKEPLYAHSYPCHLNTPHP